MLDHLSTLEHLVSEAVNELNDGCGLRLRLESLNQSFFVTRTSKTEGINTIKDGLYFYKYQDHPSIFSLWNGEKTLSKSNQIGDISHKDEKYELNEYTACPESNYDIEWLLFSPQVYDKENLGKYKSCSFNKHKIKEIILVNLT